jgi:2-dehydropantoate 2-reductase
MAVCRAGADHGTMQVVGYVVYGAGAIGGLVGGRLAQAGFDVTLIARGAHLEAIQERGLRIDSPAGRQVVAIDAVAHPGELDWSGSPRVFLAVKSQQTVAALGELARVAPAGTVVACLQNGLANEVAALRLFDQVQGVTVMCPAGHLEPGVIEAWSSPISGLFDVGRYPAGADTTSRSLVADLAAATFSARAVPDILRWKRRKLLKNLSNVVEALCGPEARSSPLTDLLVAEGERAFEAAGLEVASVDEDRARRADLLQIGLIDGRAKPGDSSWQSLQRGTGEIETDYLNGEIVLLGRTHGRPTPANAHLQHLARQAAAGRQSPGSLTVRDILAGLDRSAGD